MKKSTFFRILDDKSFKLVRKSVMKAQIKFFICFFVLAFHLLTGCGGTKQKEIALPTKNPSTATQPTGATGATGADTGQPSSPEFDPNAIPSDPEPVDDVVAEDGEKTEETESGETPP